MNLAGHLQKIQRKSRNQLVLCNQLIRVLAGTFPDNTYWVSEVLNVQCYDGLEETQQQFDPFKTLSQLRFSDAVRAAQSPPQWWRSSAAPGWKATLSSLGSRQPTGHNLCCDLARWWTPGIFPWLMAAAPGTPTSQRVRVSVLNNTRQLEQMALKKC